MRRGRSGRLPFQVLQLNGAVCAGVFWDIELVLFLNVIGEKAAGQEMLPWEARGTLLRSREGDKNIRVDSAWARLFDVPTFGRQDRKGEAWGGDGAEWVALALALARGFSSMWSADVSQPPASVSAYLKARPRWRWGCSLASGWPEFQSRAPWCWNNPPLGPAWRQSGGCRRRLWAGPEQRWEDISTKPWRRFWFTQASGPPGP